MDAPAETFGVALAPSHKVCICGENEPNANIYKFVGVSLLVSFAASALLIWYVQLFATFCAEEPQTNRKWLFCVYSLLYNSFSERFQTTFNLIYVYLCNIGFVCMMHRYAWSPNLEELILNLLQNPFYGFLPANQRVYSDLPTTGFFFLLFVATTFLWCQSSLGALL